MTSLGDDGLKKMFFEVPINHFSRISPTLFKIFMAQNLGPHMELRVLLPSDQLTVRRVSIPCPA
jgi:hypothetical protein